MVIISQTEDRKAHENGQRRN